MLGCHIQSVVPVCVPEPADIMVPCFVESSELLDQEMLQNASGINIARCSALSVPVFRVPQSIDPGAAHDLCIFKIRNLFIQYVNIACLIDVEFCGHQRPQGVIHPDSGNTVAVRNKIAAAVSDDRRICPVDADAAVIHGDHLPDVSRMN